MQRKLELEGYGQVLLYPPEKELPYSKDEMANVEAFIGDLDGKTVSQADLQQLLERFSPETREMEKLLPFSQMKDLPSPQETESVISTDTVLPKYWNASRKLLESSQKGAAGGRSHSPRPFKCTEKGKGLPPYLRVAKGDYSEKLGLLC